MDLALADVAVIPDTTLDQEFTRRLTEGTVLAFRVALGVLHNRADAEDVAQEALIRAHRGFARLRDHASFRRWLVRITWRLALDHIRAARRRASHEQAARSVASQASIEDQVVAQEFRRRLTRAVDELPEKLRIVVLLGAIEGHETGAVAELLNLPEGTVKSRLFHARKLLAEKLR